MKKIIIGLFLTNCLIGNLFALHPLTTEDTGLLGKNNNQVEAGFEYLKESQGGDSFARNLALTYSRGLCNKTDIIVSFSYAGWTASGISENGLGDGYLAAKISLGEKKGWSFVFKPGFSVPFGDEQKNLGLGKSSFFSYAVASKSFDFADLHLNAGYHLNKNKLGLKEDILKASVALVKKVSNNFSLAADFFTETNSAPGLKTHPLSSLLGVVWHYNPNLDIDAGFKMGLNKPAADSALLLGVTSRF